MTKIAKPNSIRLFNRFNFVSTLVGIANIFLHYGILRSTAIANGSSPASPFMGIIFAIISYWIFWFFIYRRGSNIAKWIFAIVTAIAVGMVPFTLGETIAVGKIYAVIDGIAFAFQIAAMATLFRADAKAWLGRKNKQESKA